MNTTFNALITTIKISLLNGQDLFSSISFHPKYFNALTCQLVKIGEHTGKLEGMLQLIAQHLEKNIAFQKRIKNALFYPLFVSIVSLVIICGMFIFVIPRFADLFVATQIELPRFTKLIFNFAQFIERYVSIFFIFILILLIVIYYSKINLKALGFELPILKQYFKNITLLRFTRNLALTFSAGIPIIEALKLVGKISEHASFNESLMRMRHYIQTGHSLHHAMQTTNLFPDFMRQMVKIGEESGCLSKMLHKTADLIEADINAFISQFVLFLEPLIILILGVLIGGLVIGIYLPILQLGRAL